jgi:peptidoglycan/LPS O-acetylase OafA/YrhL
MQGDATQHGQEGTVSNAVPRTLLAGDGLRAIAAISVLVLHAAIETMLFKHNHGFRVLDERRGQFAAIAGGAAPLLALTRAGIYVFFALSGYLLSRGFLANYILGSPRPSIKRYARNRVLRIVPAFWVVLAVYLTWDHAWRAGGPGGLIATFGLAQNYHHTGAAVIGQAWTLNIEAAFYALIPIVALIALAASRWRPPTPRGRLRLTLLVMLAAYAASIELKHLVGNPVENTYNIGQYLFAFIPGVALAAIEPFAAPRVRSAGWGTNSARLCLVAALGLLAASIYLPVAQHSLRLVCVTCGCGALLAAPLLLQWATGRCWRLLDNRPMHWLGERSYGIYLIHLGLMAHVLRKIGEGHGSTATFALLVAGAGVVTVLASDVLWRVVERPALQRRLPWRQVEFAAAQGV